MAKTWSENDWHNTKLRIIREAVNSRMEKKNFEGKSQTFKDAVKNELIKEGVKKFNEDFEFDKLKDTEKDVIDKWKPEEADKYFFGGGNEAFKNAHNPLVKKKMDDFAKLGPLVLGLADNGLDWYSMGQEDLFDAGKKLGYDTSSKKGKMDFLNDIADVQKAHDRGKMLEEFNRGNNILSELFYPTLMEEARRQITTGQGTQEQLDNAKKLDIAANFLIGAAPVIGEGSRVLQGTKLAGMAPIIGGAVGAGAQGGLEAGRQRIKEEIDPELEANYAAALLASTIGATRPGMVGTASTIAQQIPGKPMARFSRGISSATRRGNPTNAEREEFETAMELFNNFRQGKVKPVKGNTETETIPLSSAKSIEDIAASQNAILIDNYGVPVRLNQIADAQLASKVPEKLEALYGKQRASEILGSLDAQQVLKDYDAISKMWVKRNPNNFLEKVVPQAEVVNGKYMSADYLKNLEKAFPSKVSEAYGNDAWYKAGLGVGALFGGVGGSIEPALKANPLGPISGGRANIIDNDYKEAAWYKKLSKKQQEAFDDAYEKAKKANK